MGETISKALLIVGGISLALLLISFVYSAYTSQADNAQLAISKTNEMNNSLMESEYTQYDAVTVSGSEVVNVIKKHAKDELYICVVIGSNTTYYNRDASLNEVSTSAIDAKKKVMQIILIHLLCLLEK